MDPTDRLRRGKAFEREVLRSWETTASSLGPVGPRTTWRGRPSGNRRGFIDLFLSYEEDPEPGRLPISGVLVEIKNTDWDTVARKNLRRYARRAAVQLWDYLTAELNNNLEGIQLVTIYPRQPRTPGLSRYMELLFANWGVTVTWFDTGEITPPEMWFFEEEPQGDPRDPVVSDSGARDRTLALEEAATGLRALNSVSQPQPRGACRPGGGGATDDR
jgi:hypothetical protein